MPWPDAGRLMQWEVTTAAMLGYVRVREPAAITAVRYPQLRSLAVVCEAHPAFRACLPTVKEIGGTDAAAALQRLREPANV